MRLSGKCCTKHPVSRAFGAGSDPEATGHIVKPLDLTGQTSAENESDRGTGVRKLRRRRDPQAEPRVNLYEAVTRQIICQLEEGRLPWVQPWSSANATAPGLPRNALTGRNYSGINVLILWGEVISHGFASQNWLTFVRHWMRAGASARASAARRSSMPIDSRRKLRKHGLW